MKNINKVVIPIFIAIIILLLPINVSAKTLGQLKKEYSDLQQKYSDNKQSIQHTNEEISAAKSRINSIYKELEDANNEIQEIQKEIGKLNESIAQKDSQLKDLMKFFQVSKGESVYLEYIFKADSITDFIYRVTVTEQLSKYNDELITEMHAMIEENNRNIEKIHKKEEELTALQKELSEKLIILDQEKSKLEDEDASMEQEIKDSLSIIDYYIKAGCSENQDIATCAQKQLPPGTKFWRPTDVGFMQSKWNLDPLSGGGYRYHAGVDISNNTGTKIYSVSNGKVVKVVNNYTPMVGYGKYVVINHNINGQNYTSLYGHMSATNVSVGQVVTKDTVIGYMGNTGHSFGSHVHLNICVGIKACQSLSETVDPRNYINFPAHYTWYNDRTSVY